MTANTHILHTDHLKFQHQLDQTFEFRDLNIPKGVHTLILGDSGSGKTTLLHLLGGLSKPLSGTVHIDQQNIYALKDPQLDAFRASNIGFIFQEAHLINNLTILENLILAQSLAKRNINKKDILDILTKLQLAEFANQYPQKLSRGQLQRAAIARAVVNKPKLIIADEPTAALDDSNTEKVLQLLLETAQVYEATLIIATHDKRLKDNFSNTYHLMNA